MCKPPKPCDYTEFGLCSQARDGFEKTSDVGIAQPIEHLDFKGFAAFGLSWFLVTAIGLVPLFAAASQRDPQIPFCAVVIFLITVASAVVLRRHYTWLGLAMHIFGQIFIWLSLFCMSLAAVLFLAG